MGLDQIHCLLYSVVDRALASTGCTEILIEAAGEKNCVISFAVHFVKVLMARLDLELHGLFGLQDEVEREEVAGWRLESTPRTLR